MNSHTAPLRLKSKAAADYLQIVKESTLRKSRVTGLLLGSPTPRYTKIGRAVIYNAADLDSWLEQFRATDSAA